jgi:hypothetical protein
MLMLRGGGEFADQQIRRYLKNAILCFSVALVGIFLTPYVKLPLVGFVVTIVGVLAFKEHLKGWSNWTVGKQGEIAIADALKSLPDDYALLNDLMLPDGIGNIDHVVMGPNGLFVIETKNYSSYVKCFGDSWFVNGKRIHSLSKAKRNALVLRQNLAGVFKDQRVRLPYIVAVLVFLGGRSRLSIKNPTIPVLRAPELSDFIVRYNTAKAPSITSPELRRAIVHHLQVLQQRPNKLVANS